MGGNRGLPVYIDAERDPIIAVKFGFTKTCVAIDVSGLQKVLKNEYSIFTPSVVSLFGVEEDRVGNAALRDDIYDDNHLSTIYGLKTFIGRKFDGQDIQNFIKSVPFKLVNTDGAPSVEVFGKIYSPSEIIAHIFKRMKMVAEEDLEEERSATTILKKKVLKNAVIAIPAYFTSTQITILEEAFRRAELQLVSIVPEPVAAAMAYVEVSVKGEDFDNYIVDYLLSKFQRKFRIDLKEKFCAMKRVRQAAVEAKHYLSYETETYVYIRSIVNGKNLSYKLTRSTFENLTKHLINRISEVCEKSMQRANINKDEIDELIFTGGMTKMPKIREVVENVFGKEPLNNIKPDEAIIIGACVKASVVARHFTSKEYNQKIFLEPARELLKNGDYLECCEKLWRAALFVVRYSFARFQFYIQSYNAFRVLCDFTSYLEPCMKNVITSGSAVAHTCYEMIKKRQIDTTPEVLWTYCKTIEQFCDEFAKIKLEHVIEKLQKYIHIDKSIDWEIIDRLKTVYCGSGTTVAFVDIYRFLFHYFAE
uniref:Uncharacterized protein n=1 Tax=Meloidogyne javanica TaxID=6303 RepID=A0A915LYU2_MELJA